MDSFLQSLSIRPRLPSNPRLPINENMNRTIGGDGKLYIMASTEDWGKYKTLSDEQVAEEFNRSTEIRNALLATRKKSKASPYVKGDKGGGIMFQHKKTHRADAPQQRDSQSKFDLYETQENTKANSVTSRGDTSKFTVRAESKSTVEILKEPDERRQTDEIIRDRNGKPILLQSIDDSAIPTNRRDRDNEKLSSYEIAKDFDTDFGIGDSIDVPRLSRSVDWGQQRPRSAPRSSGSSHAATTGGVNINNNETNDSPSRPRSRSHSVDGMRMRGISAQLRASQNKYVQSVNNSRLREIAQKQEQERYEVELRERLLKATTHSEFKRLQAHEEAFRLKFEDKMRLKRKEKEDIARAELEESRRKISEVINKPRDGLLGKSWAEIQADQEKERTARKNKRKEELQRYMQPFKAASDEAWRRRGSTGEDEDEIVKKAVVTSKKFTEDMENRNRECLERKLAHEKRKLDKENALLEEKILKERRARERIENAKLPENARKLTKAAEDRAKAVRERIERERLEEEKAKKLAEERAKREREHAAVLKQAIALNEQDRKSKSGGYVELSSAIERAEKGKIEYKKSLRENKDKLKAALANRPSLLQRHNEKLAIAAATNSALLKVADVVSSVGNKKKSTRGKGKGKDDDDDDYEDIFEEDENMIIKAKKASTIS